MPRASQTLDILPPFDTSHQDHVNLYPSCGRLIQVFTLHYILLRQFNFFLIYLQYLARLYDLPPDQPCVVAHLAR